MLVLQVTKQSKAVLNEIKLKVEMPGTTLNVQSSIEPKIT